MRHFSFSSETVTMKILRLLIFLTFCSLVLSGQPISWLSHLEKNYIEATAAVIGGTIIYFRGGRDCPYHREKNSANNSSLLDSGSGCSVPSTSSSPPTGTIPKGRDVSKTEIRNKATEENDDEEKKGPCIIIVRDLSNKHPIFIKNSEVLIPKSGLLQFLKNEQFEVDCVQSKFKNGKKTKTIICDGNNKYKVDGQPGDVSDFNNCGSGILLSRSDSGICVGGLMINMVFKLNDNQGRNWKNFTLFSSCYDLHSKSPNYVHYKLYGEAFGEFN